MPGFTLAQLAPYLPPGFGWPPKHYLLHSLLHNNFMVRRRDPENPSNYSYCYAITKAGIEWCRDLFGPTPPDTTHLVWPGNPLQPQMPTLPS